MDSPHADSDWQRQLTGKSSPNCNKCGKNKTYFAHLFWLTMVFSDACRLGKIVPFTDEYSDFSVTNWCPMAFFQTLITEKLTFKNQIRLAMIIADRLF